MSPAIADRSISTSKPVQSSAPSFPLVGVGASAGGLDAIIELLENIRHHSEMALLVVQHLEPDHPSLLTDILARNTAMEVLEAAENQLIEKNTVYVIPPNVSMTISQGRLKLKSRDSIPGIPTPVDDLFCSLAEDQGANAVGILLSGSGSDGALGMQAIKEEGGVTFAQTDATAKFNSMPRAAVSLGCVDFVLSPKDIAEELLRISQRPMMSNHPLLLNVDHVAADEQNLRKIFHILEETHKHDFSHYKRGTLTRRLSRRVALLNLNSLEEYIRFLQANPDEVQSLYQDLLIRVTSFFRDPETFEGLTQKVFPALLDKLRAGDSVRIWVAGCSTGEEVYSIAICLIEYLNEKAASTKIQIFGTDVSEPALAIARAGSYFDSIANEVSEARLNRFFTKSNGRYQIAKSLRNLCVFANHNVTCDPPFSQLDLISCRNVLIYFNPALQKRVISLFHYALRNGGALTLGPSESIGNASDIFTQAHGNKSNFFTKRSVPPRSHLEYLSGNDKARAKQHCVPKPLSGQHEKQKREIDKIALARYAPVGVLCDDDLNILEFRGETSLYLVQPTGAPSNNLRQLSRLGLFVEISNMVECARRELRPVCRTAQRVEMHEGIGNVKLEVIPITQKDSDSLLFLVFFEKPDLSPLMEPKRLSYLWSRLKTAIGVDHSAHNPLVIDQLQRELDETRLYIKTMADEHNTAQEELKSSQEELLSSNEEFQSTNEELETAKEELQSSNEELITTNDELLHRNEELNSLNEDLEHARNYAQAIVETVREPLVVLDEHLRIVRTNAAFNFTFQLSSSQTVGCLFYELDNKQWDIPVLRQLLSDVLPKDKAFANCEITSNFSTIGTKTMMLNGKHLEWDKQTLILLAIEDITEYKTAQNELKEAAKRKDEFLAMLAHELRNPLAPMRNALEIWQRGDAGEVAEQQAQQIMDRQLRKEARLIDDLLDIARITRGTIVLDKELVDLKQVASLAVEGTHHHYLSRNHQLKVELPATPVFVEGDAVRLEQVVCNLLTNAAKYTESGGCIKLRLNTTQDCAEVRVIDNGVGISAEMLPKVFDIFVQAEVSLDRSQGGLGIGLTLVRRLVELQGGTIKASSPGTNQGCEFLVSFPLASSAEATASISGDGPVQCETAASTPFIAKRILVVDDNADAADTSASLLTLDGHQVMAVYDGNAALKQVTQFKPDIVLLDIGLPGMDGYEVAAGIKKMPDQKETLLIAVSGYAPVNEQERSEVGYFKYHMMKPVVFSDLRALIAETSSD